ncbi:D-alanine--D-alanine ligase [Anthocerotibacter panamensis]|uniref:D-alanine--D-alanine ligase n=1 Tax=Anthocerotibacter panamensis TaxID=2857077 RepID=UPI001C401EDF|nr:D-alanine--D-alanine ligase [Anthocerotibacter panamensis]
MVRKMRVGVLFGGRSAEHEVSLQSARNVIAALDPQKYEVVPIAIAKDGLWHLEGAERFLPGAVELAATEALGHGESALASLSGGQVLGGVEVVFPVLHGPLGEDGTVQGLLKLAGVPFVGSGVLGSAVGMDKDVMKRLLRDAGIPSARFLAFTKLPDFAQVAAHLGLPLFVKPANLGSSVGVHRVEDEAQFTAAVRDAFRYDQKILVEEFIAGREIECSVLGNADPIASLPGEVIPTHSFYSYAAKYTDEKGAILEIPAQLSEPVIQKVQRLALQTFAVLGCRGMARVDFFLRGEDEVLVNEINTIPGFTKISMYPKLWEASGIPYRELIDRLIQLAIEHFEAEQQLKTSFVA